MAVSFMGRLEVSRANPPLQEIHRVRTMMRARFACYLRQVLSVNTLRLFTSDERLNVASQVKSESSRNGSVGADAIRPVSGSHPPMDAANRARYNRASLNGNFFHLRRFSTLKCQYLWLGFAWRRALTKSDFRTSFRFAIASWK